MPQRPPVFRPHAKQSEQQRKRQLDSNRPSADARGYDSTWRNLRKAKLQANPLCQCDECDAGKIKVTIATVVDHIIPIRERPDLRLEWSNLRSMSKSCHDKHTAKEQGFARRSYKTMQQAFIN